jgi:hypothetical protein
MFLMALALSAAAAPERWVPVAGGEAEYLDTESLKRAGGKVTLWTRRDLPAEKATLWKEIEFDCAARTHTFVAWIRDDAGTISHNVVRPHRAAAPIARKSVEESLFQTACR